MICYGASIHTADGLAVANALSVCEYPSLFLLSPRSSTAVEILLRLEGLSTKMSSSDLVGKVAASLLYHQAVLDEQIARQRQLEEEAALRAEQDREFQEALEEDRRRAEEQRLTREKEEEEVRQKNVSIERARSLLQPEPPLEDPQVCRLRLFLPSGAKLDRRFRVTDSMQVVHSFVFLHFLDKQVSIENFELSCQYPRKMFSDLDQTIEQALGAGSSKQAVIMVRDLDA